MSLKELLNSECSARTDLICRALEQLMLFVCAGLLVFLFFVAVALMDF